MIDQPSCHPKDYPGKDVYAVIGNPIAHSRSPEIHHLFAKQTHQAIYYGKVYAPLDAFKKTVEHFFGEGGKGLNVTVPFKIEAFQLAEVLSERAKAAGAVNILYQKNGQLCGDNSDGVGLVRDLKAAGASLKGKRILLLGAGGAVQGAILPLLEENPTELVLSNRTFSKVEALHLQFSKTAQNHDVNFQVKPLHEVEHLGPYDVVINGTASGLEAASPLRNDQLKFLVNTQGAKTFAYDMLYGKSTPFLMQFKNAGAQTLDGLGMLVEQAAEAFEVWRGDSVKGKLNTREVLNHLRQN